MGGSNPQPSQYIPKPNDDLAIAQMSNQSQLGQNALANQAEMLKLTSAIPQTAYTPDVYGPTGQLVQANKVAAINAANSQKLEQAQNPYAAQAREGLQKMAAQDVSPNYWQNTMSQYGKQTGLV
jgi:hypothetical protein